MLMTLLQANYMSLFNWVLTTSAKASIFIVFLLGVKFVLRHRMGARFQDMLWSVLIIGLVLPWTPSSPVSVNNFINSSHIQQILAPISDGTTQPTPTVIDTIQSSVKQTAVVNSVPNKAALGTDKQLTSRNNVATFAIFPFIYKLMFLIWLLGILIFTVLTVLVNIRFCNKIEHNLVTDPRLITVYNQLKVELKIKAEIPLVKTRHVNSPSLLGFIHPRLLLPIGIEQTFSLEQISHIFLHELLHFKRRDIMINWLTQILVIIHWFNPLIWYAFHRMREDQEIACDALAMEQIDTAQTNDYAYTLIKLVKTYSNAPQLASMASLSGSKSQIKRRITMIKKFRQSSVKWSLLGVLVIGLIASAVFSSAKVDALSLVQKAVAVIPNPIIDVNSMLPVTLNDELVQYARKNKEGEYAYSNENDIASIAYGKRLSNIDIISKFPDIQTTEAVPVKPIFVKSYDGLMPDYYIVPFVHDHKFVDSTMVRTMPVSKAFITEAGLPTPPDKLLEVDANEAVTIMKQAKGVNNVPNPRLILYREPSSSTEYTRNFSQKAYLELYWEFVFADKTRSYVTQSKQVVTKDIAPWYETYVSPKYDPKEVKLEPNKLTRYDGWSLNVQSIVFGQSFPNDPTLKTATISFTIQNKAGDDQIFMPKGSIVGITGTGGKTYPMTFGSLDLQYIQSQKMRIEQKQTGIKPGLLKLASAISVDSAETRFSKVTYRDEQGNEFEIPVDMTPELKINPPKINGTMEPYNIQSKDWSLAITQLEFRHSIENKFVLAACFYPNQ